MTDMHRLNVAAPLPAIDNELMHLFSCGKISDTDTHGPIAQLFADVDEASIPFLTQAAITSGRLPPNALVRYRCLVQDMLDVEFYSSVFRTQSGELLFSKYRDRITSPMDVARVYDELEEVGVIGERIPLVCRPIPGESDWVRHCLTGNSTKNDTTARLPETESDVDTDSADGSAKKRRTTRAGRESEEADSGLSCLLKIYENTSSCSAARPVRLNDMLEVLGVYSSDDSLQLRGPGPHRAHPAQGLSLEELLLAEEEEEGEEDLDESAELRQERLFPASSFPRLHCLRFRVLPATHPLVPGSPCCEDAEQLQEEQHAQTSQQCQQAHSLAVRVLRGVLGGDGLAAEYAALLLLLARPALNAAQQQHCQQQDAAATNQFGNLCLNLCSAVTDESGGPDVRIARMSSFLRHLLPRSAAVQVTVEKLNAGPLFVSKHAGGGRTLQSPLQLGDGTALVLDESGMCEGKLTGGGLKNLRALKGVLTDQQLLVECSYCDIHIPTDVSAVIFSKAASILSSSSTVLVPLLPPADCMDQGAEEAPPLSDSHTQALRQWWAECRSLPRPCMDVAVAQAAERDFLAGRGRPLLQQGQDGGGEMSAGSLHRWILIAQLLALAAGSTTVTLDHWEAMQGLEARLQQRTAAAAAALNTPTAC